MSKGYLCQRNNRWYLVLPEGPKKTWISLDTTDKKEAIERYKIIQTPPEILKTLDDKEVG
jgi:hypothetical protein